MRGDIRDGDLQLRESNRTQDVDLLVVTLDEDGQIGHDRKDSDEIGDNGDHKKEGGKKAHGCLQCLGMNVKRSAYLVLGYDASHVHALVVLCDVMGEELRLSDVDLSVLVWNLHEDTIHRWLQIEEEKIEHVSVLAKLLLGDERVARIGREIGKRRGEGKKWARLKKEHCEYNQRRDVYGWSG